jgi:TolB-like protein/class 3 adenylate cyclase/predicted Zn-dependent protease
MAEEGFKRKLAAILSADVEGYSRLMDDDEEATVRTLTTYRNAINDLAQQYRGRVVDTPGDNILAEFSSVVDAVNCAVEIQRELAERNAEMPDNRKMEFRIGVNLGDIIEEKGRIYGDGVNIAARVEAMSEAGGICISGRAYDQVANKLGLEYENLGEHQVKNITTPIRVFRVLSFPGVAAHRVVQAKKAVGKRWRKLAITTGAVALAVVIAVGIWHFYQRQSTRVEAASIEKMAYPLPDKPSIAVLPFTNMSGDPEQDFLADAISENIISALSMFPNLLVIARNSTFVYKNKPVKIKQVSEELGVQYVLEGSLVKSGDKIRVTAQLIDALSGYHKWSQKYDKQMEDILNMFDEITHSISGELDLELLSGEGSRPIYKGTDNFEAWMYLVKAVALYNSLKKEDTKRAQEFLEHAISIDPNYSYAWSSLSHVYWNYSKFGWGPSRTESMKKMLECVNKALSLDELNYDAYIGMGQYYVEKKQYEKAIAKYEKALTLAPNNAFMHFNLEMALRKACRFQEALLHGKKAVRLAPFAPWYYFGVIGWDYYFLGQHEEAISWFKLSFDRCQETKCNQKFPHSYLAMAYSDNGQTEKARYHMQKVLEYDPKFNLEARKKSMHYKDPSYTERYINALRKAGAPERPPLQLPDKPSIAVLPFDNMSGDSEIDYICDGISENIITTLSKSPHLFVVNRNSTFHYKGKPVKIKLVSKELGVRYILEGSILKSGDRLRITAQLIDALNGYHIWAETFDINMGDLLTIIDEMTLEIAKALATELLPSSISRAGKAKSLEAWSYYIKSTLNWRTTREDMAKSKQFLERALEIDPNFTAAWSALAANNYHEGRYGWSASRKESFKQAKQFALKALEIDDSEPYAYIVLGDLYLMQKKYAEAFSEYEKAIAIDPNYSYAYWCLERAYRYTGQPEKAIPLSKKAMRLHPHYPWIYPYGLGRCYYRLRKYDEAIALFEQVLTMCEQGQCSPKWPHLFLAQVYSELGQYEKARSHMQTVLEHDPKFNIENRRKANPYKDPADNEREIEALRKAGAPEHPPSQ